MKHSSRSATLHEIRNHAGREHAPGFVAQMLGVHRPTVSTAANMLQQAGLVIYGRGQMRVPDAEGLRNGSCECLEIIEKQFQKVFE